jgi:hypothetical protein
VIGDQDKSARLLRKQITSQLKGLDTKEENLIDLAADSGGGVRWLFSSAERNQRR